MTFEQFKTSVFRLAKKKNKTHLIPGGNTLYRLWEQKLTPEQVVKNHCVS